MNYRVILRRLAEQDLDDAYRRAARDAPEAAARWLERFQRTLATLNHNPQRCARAREDQRSQLELRELLYGKRPNVFRVIFTVEGDAVHVLRIRRAQRRFLTKPELREFETDIGEDTAPPADG